MSASSLSRRQILQAALAATGSPRTVHAATAPKFSRMQRYSRGLYPEHPRAIDPDRDSGQIRNQYPGGGGFAGEIYNVGYTRAMLQAALTI